MRRNAGAMVGIIVALDYIRRHRKKKRVTQHWDERYVHKTR
jgi:hypothetical protein